MPKLPGINHQRAVKAFRKTGFWIVRQGKHIAMTNGDRIITIPNASPSSRPMLFLNNKIVSLRALRSLR